MSSYSSRVVVHGLVAVLSTVAAVTAAGQPAKCSPGMVYDVTVAGLRHYADAKVAGMTQANVTRLVDGDTMWVRIPCPPPGPSAEEKVRLMGLDTPEVGQPGADDATRFVRRSIGANPVYLAFDFRRRDRFDRLLAYVYLADGTLLNARLIECGYAMPYREELNHFSALFEQLAASPPPPDCPSDSPEESPAPSGPGSVVIATIANNRSHEHLLLRNDSSVDVDVSGWRILDDDGTDLLIPRVAPLPANANANRTLALCSGAGCVSSPQPSVTITDDNIWGNKGDVAVLCDASGARVDSYCYKDGCTSAIPAPRCA